MKKTFKQKLLVTSLVTILVGTHQAVNAGWLDNINKGLQSGINAIPGPNPDRVSESQANRGTVTKQEKAIAKKTANVRSGPGSKNKKIGSVPAGTQVRVTETQGDWIHIESDNVTGWTYKPLFTTYTGSEYTPPAQTGGKTRHNVFYTGYSKDFLPVKKMLRTGNLKGVESFFAKREKEVLKGKSHWDAIETIGLLRWMERGTLFLDEGNKDDSIKAFTNAERIIDERKSDSKLEDTLVFGVGTLFETVSGNEEFSAYPGEGFEKVLMLNYKSIAFLLDGERKAYNVARRAIDWQSVEQQKFEKEIKKAKQRANKEGADTQTSSDWQENYKKLDSIATRVPSAYVNPFGYYVTGLIQEYESRDDPSLRNNAKIAYEKALDLNPKSKVLQKAVDEVTKKKLNKNNKLLHIVVGDGFVPEKKMMQYNFPIEGGIVPVKLPIYEPVPTSVARIEVHSASGKKLATLSTVADVEAICLRHQKDTAAFRSIRVGLSIARAIGVNKASSKIPVFGSFIASKVNDMSSPDMRSWMSLPASIEAARLVVSKNTSKIKLVTFDKNGRRLATKTVNLTKGTDNFVYARSIDKQLYINTSDKLWTRS